MHLHFWRRVWREHGLALSVLAIHGVFRPFLPPASHPITPLGLTWRFVQVAAAALPVFAAYQVHRARSVRGGLVLLRSTYLSAAGLTGVVLASAIFATSAILHDSWKTLIGLRMPMAWDTSLADLDLLLFGRDPWRYTHWLFGSPAAARLIDVTYLLWYPLLSGGFVWVAWSTQRLWRSRLLLAWVLLWVLLGTVVAHLFASGGPAFYSALQAGDARFLPLMEHLQSVNSERTIHALYVQRWVLDNLRSGNPVTWLSMSAMPSLHVAAAALFSCATWSRSCIGAALLWCFTLLTFIGSVYLGWHYAVDGLVGIAAAALIWQLSRWAIRERRR